MLKNFDTVIINIDSSKKSRKILNNFDINGLFKIKDESIINLNIDLFEKENLKVVVLVDDKFYKLVSTNVNVKASVIRKSLFKEKINIFLEEEKFLIVDDSFYFTKKSLNNLLYDSDLCDSDCVIKLKNSENNYMLIFSKENLKYVNFDNNSFSDEFEWDPSISKVDIYDEFLKKIDNFETLISIDDEYLNDRNFIIYTPGPVYVRNKVRDILSSYVNHHRTLSTAYIYKKAAENILWAFNSEKGFPIAMLNTGLGAIESCFLNLLQENDEILVLANGFFGRVIIDIAKKNNIKAKFIDIPNGESLDLSLVEKEIQNKKAVFLVHMDTSYGILNPIKEISIICKKNNVLLIVDAISTILNEEFNFDEWNISAAVCTSTKGFETSPGLSFICVSPQALEIAKNNTKSRPIYMNWNTFINKHIYKGVTPSTYPVNIFAAINYVSNKIRESGIENIFNKKRELSNFLLKELEDLGFEHFVKCKESRSNWVVVVKTPNNISAIALRAYLYANHKLLIECGINDETNKILRFGISANHTLKEINLLIEGIKKYLELQK